MVPQQGDGVKWLKEREVLEAEAIKLGKALEMSRVNSHLQLLNHRVAVEVCEEEARPGWMKNSGRTGFEGKA